MKIDTGAIVSATEINQDFSRVACLAERKGTWWSLKTTGRSIR